MTEERGERPAVRNGCPLCRYRENEVEKTEGGESDQDAHSDYDHEESYLSEGSDLRVKGRLVVCEGLGPSRP